METQSIPKEFDALLARHDKPILADFWADWCGPCHMLAPALKELAAEWKGRVTVIKIDTERKPELASRFGVSALPTLILFKGGKEAHRLSGAAPLPMLKTEFEPFL